MECATYNNNNNNSNNNNNNNNNKCLFQKNGNRTIQKVLQSNVRQKQVDKRVRSEKSMESNGTKTVNWIG